MSLLGFLHEGPMTGWNLVATVTRQIGDFWSVTQSQVYRELNTMAELGLIRAGKLGPRDRRPYSITAAGRKVFREWLASNPGPETIRFPLLLTVLFGKHLPPGRLGEFVADHRQAHAGRRDDYAGLLKAIESAPADQPADPYIEATVRFGLAYETTVLDWFDSLPPELTGGPDTD
jgi:DNA-binding PadR family transcriptional regulator